MNEVSNKHIIARRIISPIPLIFVALILLIVSSCFSSSKRKKGENIPSISLVLLDSITPFYMKNIPKNKPTILIYFSPYCSHCQKVTESLLNNMKQFRDVQMVFISPMSKKEVVVFSNYYSLNKYDNITTALDNRLSFYKYFKPVDTPLEVVYDKNGKLIETFEGNVEAGVLLNAIKKA